LDESGSKHEQREEDEDKFKTPTVNNKGENLMSLDTDEPFSGTGAFSSK